MENVYLLIQDGSDWEDMIIVVSQEEAIALSKQYPNSRVEIFRKSEKGYIPSYNYFINGKYIRGSENLYL